MLARLQAGQSVTIPEAPFVHLFVAVGSVALEGAGELLTDALRDKRLTFTSKPGDGRTVSVWKREKPAAPAIAPGQK